jgi:pyridoxamine 5'-phosphate oxidase-like protein
VDQPVHTWGQFEAEHSSLAAFGAGLLQKRPAYLGTIRSDGAPRVHPVTPIIGSGHLFLFMEPTSPKARDLRERGAFALHNGVPDEHGTGGEFYVRGSATLLEDAELRALAVNAANYSPAARYILFELAVSEARCNGYGDVTLPSPTRWRAEDRGGRE